ncbi:acidic leucine-rich nuclear phosphoprotein 32 family member B-like [Hydractinia symbiolongicarpus]|uniref:acidic leucine-rich nuclear phosphoprotein 32 family member B-like n=1 Tax=Hydractinia symbiolongicarpus TaxID=13093 RepID=UPI00254F2724|nr:acidic leucine-rich nuclear phosphoprotein 32 family member B-like [Hydractinia symbiolongicarpus]
MIGSSCEQYIKGDIFCIYQSKSRYYTGNIRVVDKVCSTLCIGRFQANVAFFSKSRMKLIHLVLLFGFVAVLFAEQKTTVQEEDSSDDAFDLEDPSENKNKDDATNEDKIPAEEDEEEEDEIEEEGADPGENNDEGEIEEDESDPAENDDDSVDISDSAVENNDAVEKGKSDPAAWFGRRRRRSARRRRRYYRRRIVYRRRYYRRRIVYRRRYYRRRTVFRRRRTFFRRRHFG